MAKVGLARVAVFNPFVSYLVNGGSSLDRYLATAGIDPTMLANENALIPLHWACEFVTGIGRAEGIDGMGFKVGAETRISELGELGNALKQSLTLKDILERLLIWVPATDSGAQIWMEDGTTPAHLKLCLKHDVTTGRPIVDGFALMILIDAARMALGPDWRPRRFWIDKAAGSDVANYEALSEGVAHRAVDYVAFEIPRSALSLPVRSFDHKASRESIKETPLPMDLIGSLIATIESGLGSRLPVIEEAAGLAGISRRTLQRRLREEGLSYRNLVDRVRFQQATHLLSDPSLGINDIARHLGYSELSNFTHAFHRWTGASPSIYRIRQNGKI